MGKISGQRRVEQIRKAAMPTERFAGLWAKGIRSEMNEAERNVALLYRRGSVSGME